MARCAPRHAKCRKALASIAPLLDRIDVVERRQITDQQRNEERFDTIFKAMDGGDFPPQKVFYDGQLWDARAFVDRLVKSARKSLLLVDNWTTEETLDMLAAKQKGVAVTVLTSEHPDRKGNPRPKILPPTSQSSTPSIRRCRSASAKTSTTGSSSLTTANST